MKFMKKERGIKLILDLKKLLVRISDLENITNKRMHSKNSTHGVNILSRGQFEHVAGLQGT